MAGRADRRRRPPARRGTAPGGGGAATSGGGDAPLSARLIRAATLAVALAALNFTLAFENLWPTLAVAFPLKLSVEAAALVLGLALLGGLGRPASARQLTFTAALLALLAIARYAQVTTAGLYGRPVHLFFDAPHLPNVLAMLAKVAEPWQLAAGALVLGGAGVLLYLAMRRALARIAEASALDGERRAICAVGVLVVAGYVAGGNAPGAAREAYAEPVTVTLSSQAARWREAAGAARSGERLPPPAELGEGRLGGAAGPDVLVVFVESYGAVAYDRPDAAAALGEERARFAEAIERTGRGVVSALVESPTFAGASWLAHASFLTGTRIADGGAYEALLGSRRDTLAKRFGRAGYRALAIMPGLREPWPEGAFYGFDALHDAAGLDYRGPAFGWWRIPDQFAAAKLRALEREDPARRPLFTFFPTLSTHVPFRPIPPYQPDWTRLEGPAPYDEDALAASLSRAPDWFDLAPAYFDSLRYALRTWAGYLEERAGEDLVLVMLGDHQPAASITGPDARYDVPVHVIADRASALETFERQGFSRGVVPPPDSIGPMHELAPLLLEALSR